MSDQRLIPDSNGVSGRGTPNYTTPLSNALQAEWLFSTHVKKGAWIVYSYDTNAYPIALFDKETEALRKCVELGYGKVKFWEFGTDWSD